MIEGTYFSILLLLYSFSVFFLGWCSGEHEGRKKYNRLKRIINSFYGSNYQ